MVQTVDIYLKFWDNWLGEWSYESDSRFHLAKFASWSVVSNKLSQRLLKLTERSVDNIISGTFKFISIVDSGAK